MVNVATISADLLANDAQFVDGMNRAATSVGRFAQSAQKDINSLSKTFDKLASGITGISTGLAGITTLGGLALLTRSALDSADAVDRLSKTLGLSTDEVQKFQYAAQQSGATNQDLESGFNHLNKLIEEGKVPYSNLSQAITDVSSRMENTSSAALRAQIAFDMFGKSGVNLIQMFSSGPDKIRAFGDQLQRLGGVLSPEQIKNAEEFKTQIDNLATVFGANFKSGFLDGFTKDSKKISDIYTDPSFLAAVQGLGTAFGAILKAVTLIAQFSSILRATFIDMPQMAGQGIANHWQTGSVKATTVRPKTIDSGAIPGLADAMKASANTGNTGDPFTANPKAVSQLDKYTESLSAQTTAIGLSEKALFEQKALIEANADAQKDYDNNLRDSPDLTQKETDSITGMAGSLYDLKNAQQQAEKFNQEFKSGFEDAAESIVNGSKTIGAALKDLVNQFAALIIKEEALQPLADAIFGAKGSGGTGVSGLAGLFSGGLGSLLGGSQGDAARLIETGSSNFIGPLPVASFDVGTSYVPNDMTANIHKGEAVLTPQQADSWRSGKGMGGDSYVINAPGASKQDIAALKSTIMTLAGPGRVEDRIAQAQKRGKLA